MYVKLVQGTYLLTFIFVLKVDNSMIIFLSKASEIALDCISEPMVLTKMWVLIKFMETLE